MSFKALGEAAMGVINRVIGESITYTPSVGSPATIYAVFENAWVDVEGVVTLKPTLRIKLADLVSSPAKGDQVTVSGTTYKVMESRVDGYGGSTLILQKA